MSPPSAGGGLSNGVSIATGIGLHDVPEGLAVPASLISVGYGRGRACAVGLLTGLVEPVGGLFGSTAVWVAQPRMPWMPAFAAGAMLFIISHEVIPETHRRGYGDLATFSLLAGFCVMMFLDAAPARRRPVRDAR